MIKLFFNHLRFYIVVVMDFNEKRSKNETRPFIRTEGVLKFLGLQSAIPVNVIEQKRHGQELPFLYCGVARIQK
jgi:hypothetical protein